MTNIISRTFVGVKKGFLKSTLSEEIIVFQARPVIRILRVIGGFSCLSLLGRSFIKIEGVLLFVAIFFTFLFLIYHLYLLKNRYDNIKKVLNSDELDVRNSPFD